MVKPEWVEARRTFERDACQDGYKTLTEVGLDGCWVTPIQMTSDSPCGPVLVAYNFLGWEQAIERRTEILGCGGYLPDMKFNRVLDLALRQADMHRRDIYVTQVLHLLPQEVNDRVPRKLLRRSFESVTQLELQGRRVITLGVPAKEECDRWLEEHPGVYEISAQLPHPSARGAPDMESRANTLAEALIGATDRRCR